MPAYRKCNVASKVAWSTTKTAAVVVLTSLAVFSALGAVLYQGHFPVAANEPERDAQTWCRKGGSLTRHDIVVFDLTDPLSETDWHDARGEIESIRDNLPPNGKLTVLLVDPQNPFKPIELFSRCTTGKPSGKDTLTSTGSFEVQVWEDEFSKPLQSALVGLPAVPAAEPSPIMETLTAMTWRRDFSADVAERNVVLVSDLAQHDPHGYSQLRYGVSWRHYMESHQYNDAKPDLRGVRVKILYINRPKWRSLQTTEHVKFWQKAFDRFGAKVVFLGAPAMPADPITIIVPKPKPRAAKPQCRGQVEGRVRISANDYLGGTCWRPKEAMQ